MTPDTTPTAEQRRELIELSEKANFHFVRADFERLPQQYRAYATVAANLAPALARQVDDLKATVSRLRSEIYATIDRYQDLVGWQPGESRNKLVCDIRDAVMKQFAAFAPDTPGEE